MERNLSCLNSSEGVSAGRGPPSALGSHAQLLAVIGLFCFWLFLQRTVRPRRRQVPGPFSWPLIGNLFSLGPLPHLTAMKLAEKYGSVFRLRLGTWDTVVVSGYTAVKVALLKKGDTFASRPAFESYKEYAGGKSISFRPYDRSLKLHRLMAGKILKKLVINEPDMLIKIQNEAQDLLEKWSSYGDNFFDPRMDISVAMGNILYRLCYGDGLTLLEDKDMCEVLLGENPGTELFGAGNQVDLMPWLRHFSKKSLHERNIDRMRRLVEHNKMKAREHLSLGDRGEAMNVMDAMIHEAANRGLAENGSDVCATSGLSLAHFINTTIEFMSAGTDTSSTTIQWLLVYMVAYPVEQELLFSEIEAVIGRDAEPSFNDRYKLPRTEAFLTEVMRMTTIVPFALPHFSLRDSELFGYHIPKDTLVLANLWSVNHDPSIWDSPDQFRPSRFLHWADGHIKFNRRLADHCVPFSIGKRRCTGEILGRIQVFIIFVAILQKYKVISMNGREINMEPIYGDIMKPQPFKILLQNRM